MITNKFISAEAAAELVNDDVTVGLIGGGGGLVEATLLHEAIEKRFINTGQPRNLSCIHALGIGDREQRGMNRFAHEGMVKRVIGGHWVWSPRMQQLAKDNKIEAYVLPGGVVMQLMREIAAKRPGLITHVGLGTFVDPRFGGGKMNTAAKEDLVKLLTIDGKTYLRYLPMPVDIALLKGSIADEDGNISLDQEPANVDIYAMAAAVHNCGGKVIFQVRERVERGALPARSVRIPSAIVDAVVVDENQRQGYDIVYDPSLSGEKKTVEPAPSMPPLTVRQIVARRAYGELKAGAVINYGFGIPDEVATIVAALGEQNNFYQTIEHGTYGGTLLTGSLFGYARNPACMIDGPSQFDFYSGGGLDIAFLGFGELDRQGNVNVSRLGGLTVGPGGFIDIAQNARKVVFCGTFQAKGLKLRFGEGALQIDRHGDIRKLVNQVEQITFSGEQALAQGQEVIYITERAVFRLEKEGVVLLEIAPGVDLQKDVLDQMDFTPIVPEVPRFMNKSNFLADFPFPTH
ncbi:MAG: acyl CoA:acetate/3-ketoacid CoA transferase [Gammaproteobacteria bacterium]|nr:acyl CoA:acetate/3-ketoacid CoA transferase [Gammaproteobacteria bacterium]